MRVIMLIVCSLLALAESHATERVSVASDRSMDCRHQPYAKVPLRQKVVLRLAAADGNDIVADDAREELAFVTQFDLSTLSKQQMKQLIQQLPDTGLSDELAWDDERGSAFPWRKWQRILHRQLVKLPKRYLKKILRQFGLRRSVMLRAGDFVGSQRTDDIWFYVPSHATDSLAKVGIAEAGILLQEPLADSVPVQPVQLKGHVVGDHYVFPLN